MSRGKYLALEGPGSRLVFNKQDEIHNKRFCSHNTSSRQRMNIALNNETASQRIIVVADLAEMLPPVTFVVARRYRHRFKSGMRLFLSKRKKNHGKQNREAF